MKQFNLGEYLTNPDRHIVTRSRKDAKIICTDGSNKTYPILALIQNEEGKDVLAYTNDGMNVKGYESPFDLFFVPEKKEGWVNVYKYRFRCTHLSGIIYSSKEEAESDAEVHESGINTYITTIKIEWEE